MTDATTPESVAIDALRTEFNAQIASLEDRFEKRVRSVENLFRQASIEIREDLINLITGRLEVVEPTEEEDQFVAEVMERVGQRSAERNRAMNTPPDAPPMSTPEGKADGQ